MAQGHKHASSRTSWDPVGNLVAEAEEPGKALEVGEFDSCLSYPTRLAVEQHVTRSDKQLIARILKADKKKRRKAKADAKLT